MLMSISYRIREQTQVPRLSTRLPRRQQTRQGMHTHTDYNTVCKGFQFLVVDTKQNEAGPIS